MGNALAGTLYVSATAGADQNDGLTWDFPKRSLQAAIDTASNNDLILVSNGTYTATGDYVVNITKSLTIQSVNGPDVTLIDGENARYCVYADIATAGDPTALSGFTLTRGSTASFGAGIYKNNYRDLYVTNCLIYANKSTGSSGGGVCKISAKSRMFMYDCVISNNTAASSGGGIFANIAAGLYLYDCEIVNNSAILYNGGGIYAAPRTSSGTVIEVHRCRIAGNSANGAGGGVLFIESDAPEASGSLNDCIIENNSAHTSSGGGIYRSSNGGAEFLISNCVIRGNTSPYGGDQTGAGIRFDGACRITGCLITGNQGTSDLTYGGGIAVRSGAKRSVIENTTIAYNSAGRISGGIHVRPEVADCLIQNCIIYGNTISDDVNRDVFLAAGATPQFTRSCVGVGSGMPPDADVFDSDPLFIDAANNNYRLLPDSPCINAGITMPQMSQAVDLDGRSRLDHFSKLADIGCYEFVPQGILFRMR